MNSAVILFYLWRWKFWIYIGKQFHNILIPVILRRNLDFIETDNLAFFLQCIRMAQMINYFQEALSFLWNRDRKVYNAVAPGRNTVFQILLSRLDEMSIHRKIIC